MATVYRADTIGSLLRPPYLKLAREQFEAGQLEPTAYKEIEDRAVDQAIAMQEGVGLDVVTDGEDQRGEWLLPAGPARAVDAVRVRLGRTGQPDQRGRPGEQAPPGRRGRRPRVGLGHVLEDAAEVAEADGGVYALGHLGRLQARGPAAADARAVDLGGGQRGA